MLLRMGRLQYRSRWRYLCFCRYSPRFLLQQHRRGFCGTQLHHQFCQSRKRRRCTSGRKYFGFRHPKNRDLRHQGNQSKSGFGGSIPWNSIQNRKKSNRFIIFFLGTFSALRSRFFAPQGFAKRAPLRSGCRLRET